MKRLVLLLFLMSTMTFMVQAQQDYDWRAYGLTFTLADDFVEETNNADEFSAAGDGMYFSILPFNDGSIDKNDIVSYTIEIAASLELEEVDDVSTIDLNYFKGGYVEGYKDGNRLFLMGLIDPKSDTNFFVIITFLDYDDVATDEAIRMVSSIRKM